MKLSFEAKCRALINRWREANEHSDWPAQCADELEAALAASATEPKPCQTPERCRYDPVLRICDACGADVVLRAEAKP